MITKPASSNKPNESNASKNGISIQGQPSMLSKSAYYTIHNQRGYKEREKRLTFQQLARDIVMLNETHKLISPEDKINYFIHTFNIDCIRNWSRQCDRTD
uniref:Uncharacterized protein n=1 Tax=Opuntia streptacantha TaxID=393608 RepID=A0A7C8YMZ0_OPUST